MPQHFIKIEIKGDQRNLPEENGDYLVHSKYSKTGECHNRKFIRKLPYGWLNEVEYYFLPVPEPQQPEQTESAEKYKLTAMDFVIKPGQCKYCGRSDNFASQSHNNTVVGPTEEEVMSYFNNHTSNVVNNGYVTLKAMVRSEFLDAIKWFRSQVREVELKGELERIIIDFINGRFKTILFSTASKKEVAKLIVDDYLSARKEGE